MGLLIAYTKAIKQKEEFLMEVEIRHIRGHVEVFSWEGKFLFSADTEYEARMELLEDAA